MKRGAFLVLLAIAATCAVLLILHTPFVVGPAFWRWPYRSLPAGQTFGLFALASIPILLGMIVDGASRIRRFFAIVLLMIGCFTLKLASIASLTTPASLDYVFVIVDNPDATGYYTNARGLASHPIREWMSVFPELMPQLALHPRTKPPGGILYWLIWVNAINDPAAAARWGGYALGLLATLGIPATYGLTRRLSQDTNAAFAAAALLSAAPGFVLFFPMFDPTYILLSAALIGSWHAAITTGKKRFAAFCGFTLGAIGLISFNLLVLGLFLALLPLAIHGRPNRAILKRLAVQASIVLATAIAVLLMLQVTVGYDVIGTFKSAWVNQQELLRRHGSTRLYPQTVPFDLLDLALGVGWISAALAHGYFLMCEENTIRRRIVWLGIGQLLAVAILALLQLETARVWNFMYPLVLLPAGISLSQASRWQRFTIVAALIVLTAVTHQNVKFIY